jgi:exodeoxyribonuclease VIII
MKDLSTLPDGIYTDISDEEYFGDKSRVNCSTLKKVIMSGGSTAYLKEIVKPTKAMRIGTAFHTLVLEPNEFDNRFIVIPDVSFATKEGKAYKEKYSDCVFADEKDRDSDDGKVVVIKEPDYDDLQNLKTGLLVGADGRATLADHLLRQPGDVEAVVLFTYLGVPCKIKIDKLLEDYHCLDVKTCLSCKADDFARASFDRGYFIQSAFYKLAFKCLADADVKFTFLAVEKTDNIWLSQCYNTNSWDAKAQALIDYYLPVTYEAMKTKVYSTYTGHDQQEIISLPLNGWIEKSVNVMLGA